MKLHLLLNVFPLFSLKNGHCDLNDILNKFKSLDAFPPPFVRRGKPEMLSIHLDCKRLYSAEI